MNTLKLLALIAGVCLVVYTCSYHPTAQENEAFRQYKAQRYLDKAAEAESDAVRYRARAVQQ